MEFLKRIVSCIFVGRQNLDQNADIVYGFMVSEKVSKNTLLKIDEAVSLNCFNTEIKRLVKIFLVYNPTKILYFVFASQIMKIVFFDCTLSHLHLYTSL